MAITDMQKNPMMAHLLAALERGEDIGHYGRLVFAMVARHFLSDDELCSWLEKNVSPADARSLVLQVQDHDYNPPRRERILAWQNEQPFPICPGGEGCNVYRDLRFPEHVYEHIQEFYRERAGS